MLLTPASPAKDQCDALSRISFTVHGCSQIRSLLDGLGTSVVIAVAVVTVSIGTDCGSGGAGGGGGIADVVASVKKDGGGGGGGGICEVFVAVKNGGGGGGGGGIDTAVSIVNLTRSEC